MKTYLITLAILLGINSLCRLFVILINEEWPMKRETSAAVYLLDTVTTIIFFVYTIQVYHDL